MLTNHLPCGGTRQTRLCLSALLATYLTACSPQLKRDCPVQPVVTIKQYPPAKYLADVPMPLAADDSIDAALNWVPRAQAAIQRLRGQMADLRKWAAEDGQ